MHGVHGDEIFGYPEGLFAGKLRSHSV